MFRYIRTWKLSTSVNISGACFLEGSNWINKLEFLLEHCQISLLVVTSLKVNYSNNSSEIDFYNRDVKLYCESKIEDYLTSNYPNKVFIM